MTRLTLKFVPLLFGVTGIVLLGVSGWLMVQGLDFSSNAARADGVVIRLDRRYSTDGDGHGGYLYYPVVCFMSATGAEIEFRGSTGSSPSAFRKGEEVIVLYLPETRNKARIESFSGLWLGPLITGAIGLVFAAIAGGFLLVRRRRAQLEAWMRVNGWPVEADYTGVTRDRSFKVNGQAPWPITAQWRDPAHAEVHVFKSKRLWFDPAPFIDREKLNVLIDPTNPKRHVFDLSFLPEIAA